MSVEEKAVRLLADGKVHIWADSLGLHAYVEGDSGTYVLKTNGRGEWFCTCPSRKRPCSHASAVERITRTWVRQESA